MRKNCAWAIFCFILFSRDFVWVCLCFIEDLLFSFLLGVCWLLSELFVFGLGLFFLLVAKNPPCCCSVAIGSKGMEWKEISCGE